MNPHARKESLLVEELSDETLVYDEERHKAHCLNQTAAFVWHHCDGQTSVGELARLLEDELGIRANEEVVWLALDRLERVQLLQRRAQHGTETPRYSRRQLVTRLGQIGIAIPMVVSIVAPLAAAAVSCVDVDTCEKVWVPPICNNQPICGAPGQCCGPEGIPPNCKKHSCV